MPFHLPHSPRTLLAAPALAAVVLSAGLSVAVASGPEQVKVTAPDGVLLNADLYLPAKLPAPVVLARTPYGAGGLDFLGEALSARGYVVMIQDVRGRYGSGGDHEPFRHERGDGLATLRWIAKQSWCDGRIGMWGSSYSGFAALSVADAKLPAFRSIFHVSGWLDSMEVIRPGGANHLILNLPWMLTQQGRLQRNLREFDVDGLFRHLPPKDALRSAGIRNDDWENPDWVDDLMKNLKREEIPRPVFHVTGWHDMVYRATLGAWKEMSTRSPALQKLAIGPWYHNQMLFEDLAIGDATFGEASGFGVAEMLALTTRWFDATLRGEDNGILDEPPVSFFVMGQDAWHHQPDWPVAPGVRPERWYLSSTGDSSTRDGGGRLSRRKPKIEAVDRFVYDPSDPAPTLGGAVFFYFPELLGVRDQRAIEDRPDVLVYTSEPLDEELQITGRVSVSLAASSSAPGTDFTAKLVIVRPDGYARIVEDGIVRVGAPASPPLKEGESVTMEIDLGHTAVSVPPGHRLRVEISSSNFPKYDRNPNTGVDPFLATELKPAQQAIHLSRKTPAWIELPVRRRLLVADAAARQPLMRAAENGPGASAATVAQGSDLLAAGKEQLDAGDHEAAIVTLLEAVAKNPEGSEGHHVLGRAYLAKLNQASLFKKLSLSKKVRASYLRAIELDPDNIEARASLAGFFFNAPSIAGGDRVAGEAQVAEIGKRDARRAHLILAAEFARRKEPDKALAEYRSALALDPKDPLTHYRVGVLHQNARRWAEAFAAFESALKVDSEHFPSLYQIGRTGVFSGDNLSRARQALESYIAAEPQGRGLPSVATAYWRLGMVHERGAQVELARKSFQLALELEPDLEQARESLQNLSR